jgi:hypothetical protein
MKKTNTKLTADIFERDLEEVWKRDGLVQSV